MFKQLFQAGAVDLVQIDAARVGGVNENLAILLLAAHFGVRVFPHAGGVGLCELVQHLAMADFVAITGRKDDRSIEFVDHLHEHFVDPVTIRNGHYIAPTAPGFSGRDASALDRRVQLPRRHGLAERAHDAERLSMAAPITNIIDLREMARRRVPRAFFEYGDRGSYDEVTIRENRACLRAHPAAPARDASTSTTARWPPPSSASRSACRWRSRRPA